MQRRLERIEQYATPPKETSKTTFHTDIAMTTEIDQAAQEEKTDESSEKPTEQGAELSELQQLSEKNAALQRRLDEMEFNKFLESDEIAGRVTPAMREEVMELYHSAYEADARRGATETSLSAEDQETRCGAAEEVLKRSASVCGVG